MQREEALETHSVLLAKTVRGRKGERRLLVGGDPSVEHRGGRVKQSSHVHQMNSPPTRGVNSFK